VNFFSKCSPWIETVVRVGNLPTLWTRGQTVHALDRDDYLFRPIRLLGGTCLRRKQPGVFLEREGSRRTCREQAGFLMVSFVPCRRHAFQPDPDRIAATK
jgi:hypothetical protein